MHCTVITAHVCKRQAMQAVLHAAASCAPPVVQRSP
jgi:hypothetical protein